jgi:hypothetical protein
MVEALGMVHTRRKGLLRGLWWSVGPTLVFEQIAEVVQEIVDASFITDEFANFVPIWCNRGFAAGRLPIKTL